MRRLVGAAYWVLSAALIGCGGEDNEKVLEAAQGQNCGAAAYTPSDPKNHAEQDERVAAQVAINAAIEPALTDPALAAEIFAEVEVLYADTASLKEKVQGRADDHTLDDPDAQSVGADIDARIVDGITRGKAATTALEVAIAKQLVDKSLTHFFYLSVFHELVEGARDKYDEAYGYLGTGPTNDAASRRSIASIATKRDTDNGTALAEELFDEILEGSCALDTRLDADRVTNIVWTADPQYAEEVREIDTIMLEVLALSVGHEFMKPLSELEPEEAVEKLYEGSLYFFAVERAMVEKGSTAASDAEAIRAMIDPALQAFEAGDPDWQTGFDAVFIRDRVAAAFGVTPKG